MAKFNMFNTKEDVRTGMARRVGAGALAVGLVGGAAACGNEGGGISGLAGNLTGNSVPYGPSCENHKDKALDVGLDTAEYPEDAITTDAFISQVEKNTVVYARLKNTKLQDIDLQEINMTPDQREQLLDSVELLETSYKPDVQKRVDEARESGLDLNLTGVKVAILNKDGVVYHDGTIQGQPCIYTRYPENYSFTE